MNKKLNKFRYTKTKDIELSKRLKSDSYYQYKVECQLTDFVDLLGYDRKRFPIYAVIDNSTFEGIRWFEATNFQKSEYSYNVKLKSYEWGKSYFSLEQNILKHSFPLELKNKIKYKNKKFYSKDVDDEILHNMHFISDNMCGAYFKEYSNVIAIDIDNHNNEGSLYTYQIMKDMISYVGQDPIYMEVSNSGGYHLFFKLDREYSLAERKCFINEFNKKHSTNIESPSKMRCPNSLPYTPIDSEGELFSYLTAIDKSTERYNISTGISLNITEEQKSAIVQKERIESSVFKRQRSSNICFLTPDEYILKNENSISSGNRVSPMYKVICAGKFNGWSEQDILTVIRSCNDVNSPSKDLSKWNDTQLEKEIFKAYSSCKVYAPNSSFGKPDKFISNINYIPSHILSIIDDKFIKLLIKQVYQSSHEYKVSKKNIKKFSIIYKEMIGSIFYNTHNNRSVKEHHNEKHLIGIQFPLVYAEMMKNHYKDELETTDVWGIINSILKHSKFFKQYKINNRGWKFNPEDIESNFCRQFDIFSNSNHVLFNDKTQVSFLLFNSLKEYITKYSKFVRVSQMIKDRETILYIEFFSILNTVKHYLNHNSLIDYDVGLCNV